MPNTNLRLVLLRALNASAGMPFAPGDLLFSICLVASLNVFQVIGSSRVGINWRWGIFANAYGEMSLWLLNILWQCGSITDMFSLSLVARFPLGRWSNMVDLGTWLTLLPAIIDLTTWCNSLGRLSSEYRSYWAARCDMWWALASLTVISLSLLAPCLSWALISSRLVKFGSPQIS